MGWDLLVDRTDLATTEVVEQAVPDPGDGEVVLRVDRVGMTANNVTYAVFGDDLRYWDFFPVPSDADGRWGRVPLWGFAEVVRSTVPEVAEGTRVYGFLPTGSHLVVEPAKIDRAGFRDARPHRRVLPSAYNSYALTTVDPIYAADQEDVQVLFRPLFMLSLMLSDFALDADCFGAEAVLISSASSKTAYGTAFLLDGVHRIGLTSAGNCVFTEGLGCYDEVRTYDEIEELAPGPVVYLDVAGDSALRRRVHERLAPVHSAVVGATHHAADPDPTGGEDLPGAPPAFFFAPDQLRKRAADWGPGGIEARHTEAWTRFAPVATGWVDVTVGQGPDGLAAAWHDVLAGSTAPRTGHVVALGD
jgi:hypothetical protein